MEKKDFVKNTINLLIEKFNDNETKDKIFTQVVEPLSTPVIKKLKQIIIIVLISYVVLIIILIIIISLLAENNKYLKIICKKTIV